MLQFTKVAHPIVPIQNLDLPSRFDSFLILRKIVHQGMADIYEAQDRDLDRHVAIKVLNSNVEIGELRDRFEREQRVLARLHHTHIVPIHAKGTVVNGDGGSEGKLDYFVMPFINGTSLNKVVNLANLLRRRNGTTSLPTILKIVTKSEVDGITSVESSVRSTDDNDFVAIAWLQHREFAESVVHAMADIADAVHAPHTTRIPEARIAGIVHRDIKPHEVPTSV